MKKTASILKENEKETKYAENPQWVRKKQQERGGNMMTIHWYQEKKKAGRKAGGQDRGKSQSRGMG